MFVIVYFVMIWAFTSSLVQAGDTCSKSYDEQMLEKMLRMELNMELLQKHDAKQDADLGEFKDSQTAERTVMMDEMQRWSKEWMGLRTSVTEQLQRNKNAMQNNAEKNDEVVLEQTQLQEELELLESRQTPVVAFNAYGLSVTTVATMGTVIKFPNVLLNEGSGYNNATGIFTAPVGGLYQFTAHFCNRGTKYAVLGITHNGVLNAVSTVGDSILSSCGSVNALIRIRRGDLVNVESFYADTNLSEDQYRQSSFIGVLLNHT